MQSSKKTLDLPLDQGGTQTPRTPSWRRTWQRHDGAAYSRSCPARCSRPRPGTASSGSSYQNPSLRSQSGSGCRVRPAGRRRLSMIKGVSAGSYRLDKIFLHDISMTISQFSMTVSHLDCAFAAICGIHKKMQTSYT